MNRLRYRLARALVGPFVNLPEGAGVWIVTRQGDPPFVVVFEADKFRLKMQTNLRPLAFDAPLYQRPTRTTGRFVGTVKVA